MYRLTHYSYCGMAGIPEEFDDRDDARAATAQMIRSYRGRYAVSGLFRGLKWEVIEPEDAVMVPDECGTICLDHIPFECRECGCDHETKAQAWDCCSAY